MNDIPFNQPTPYAYGETQLVITRLNALQWDIRHVSGPAPRRYATRPIIREFCRDYRAALAA